MKIAFQENGIFWPFYKIDYLFSDVKWEIVHQINIKFKFNAEKSNETITFVY